jgi:hypothetical protein
MEPSRSAPTRRAFAASRAVQRRVTKGTWREYGRARHNMDRHPTHVVKLHPFLEAEKVAGHNVKRSCELLEVSRAAFYERPAATPSGKSWKIPTSPRRSRLSMPSRAASLGLPGSTGRTSQLDQSWRHHDSARSNRTAFGTGSRIQGASGVVAGTPSWDCRRGRFARRLPARTRSRIHHRQ